MPDDISSDAQAVPTDGGETASQVESKELHEVLNEMLGTTYKSPEDAIAGEKELRNYVGKTGKYEKPVKSLMETKGLTEDQAVKYLMDSINTPVETPTAPDNSQFVSKKEFEEAMFYKDNADLAPFKDVLNSLSTTTGKSLAEAAQLESFKPLIEAKKAADLATNSESVLHSNSRIGVVQDNLTKASDSFKSGDQKGAEAAALAAVMEAYELK